MNQPNLIEYVRSLPRPKAQVAVKILREYEEQANKIAARCKTILGKDIISAARRDFLTALQGHVNAAGMLKAMESVEAPQTVIDDLRGAKAKYMADMDHAEQRLEKHGIKVKRKKGRL